MEQRGTSNDIGLVQRSEQDHAGAVGGTEPKVEYTYDETVASNLYDDGLRLEKVTYPGGDIKFYTYNTAGGIDDRLHRVYEIRETTSTGTQLTKYAYNGLSRLVKSEYPTPNRRYDIDANDGDGDYESWDRFGRTRYVHWAQWSGATPTYHDFVEYAYDYAGNRTFRNVYKEVISGATVDDWDHVYTYDELHRLESYDQGIDAGLGDSISTKKFGQLWTLDQLGNWWEFKEDANGDNDYIDPGDLDQDRDHNEVNEIDTDLIHGDADNPITTTTGIDWVDPKYDAAGNMTEAPKPGSEATKHKYVYDAWNRLVKVTDASDVTIASFKYDGLHRRITKVDVTANPDITYDYYYNENWQMVEERKNSNVNPLNQYVWHPYYIDALGVRYYDADTDNNLAENNDGKHYSFHDALFSVTGLVNDSATVLERYTYTPYGEATVLDANFSADSDNVSDIGNVQLFTGRERDAETGLQQSRYRYHHAQLGRWLTRDPIEYGAGDANLDGYVGAHPTRFADPSGLFGGPLPPPDSPLWPHNQPIPEPIGPPPPSFEELYPGYQAFRDHNNVGFYPTYEELGWFSGKPAFAGGRMGVRSAAKGLYRRKPPAVSLPPSLGEKCIKKPGPRISSAEGQKALRDPKSVNQIKDDMLNDRYRFTDDDGRIGGFVDDAGNYYIGEGHHRMNAAMEIFEETGDRSYVQGLIDNGLWTPGRPPRPGPLPRR